MRFLGFGRGSIYLDPEDGHWYNERNGKAKCNVAKVVLPHHDINCEDYQERLRTSCNSHGISLVSLEGADESIRKTGMGT